MCIFKSVTLLFSTLCLLKAITKPILDAVIENHVFKQTSAIYFFKVGIPDLDMTKMKCQNKRQKKTNFNLSCFPGVYSVIKKSCLSCQYGLLF
jgi:hypothetical protein